MSTTLIYIYDVNNDYEYDQYHYPPQNYDEGCKNYNYEEESHLAGYTPPDKNLRTPAGTTGYYVVPV